ncbi:Serine/threonine-protein phosphatase 2A activator 2 [Rhodotorula toruloides]|nr:Serine/threonine-protein phosphatase 2A activator 2 [Rhodotorula toruloides]
MATDAPTGPVVPTKRVVSKAHLEAWLKSGTHDEVVAFVEQLNEAAVGVKLAYERGAHFPGAVVVLLLTLVLLQLMNRFLAREPLETTSWDAHCL